MSNEMIERVAKAIYAISGWRRIHWDNLDEGAKGRCRADAIIIIEALREPTQAMADVGHRDYWYAMIDEALR